MSGGALQVVCAGRCAQAGTCGQHALVRRLRGTLSLIFKAFEPSFWVVLAASFFPLSYPLFLPCVKLSLDQEEKLLAIVLPTLEPQDLSILLFETLR